MQQVLLTELLPDSSLAMGKHITENSICRNFKGIHYQDQFLTKKNEGKDAPLSTVEM